MAKSKVFTDNSGETGKVKCPMTSFSDVAFILILFFLLAAQMASQSFAALEVAKPLESQAGEDEEEPSHVIVNVVCKVNPNDEEGDPALSLQASEYSIDGQSYPVRGSDSIDALVALFEERRASYANSRAARATGADKSAFWIELRGDARVRYLDIEPVLIAAARAEISKLRITAEME